MAAMRQNVSDRVTNEHLQTIKDTLPFLEESDIAGTSMAVIHPERSDDENLANLKKRIGDAGCYASHLEVGIVSDILLDKGVRVWSLTTDRMNVKFTKPHEISQLIKRLVNTQSFARQDEKTKHVFVLTNQNHYNFISAEVDGRPKSLFDKADLEPLVEQSRSVGGGGGVGGGGCGQFEGWVVLVGVSVVRFLVLASQRFGDSVRKADSRAVFRSLLVDLGLSMFAVMAAAAARLIRPDHLQRAVVAAMVGWFVSCGCVIGLMSARGALDLDDAAASALAYAATFGVSIGAAGFS